MELMIAGLMLWSVVHLFPALAPGLRHSLVGRIGENGYKGLFALLIVLSVVLIVFGWRHTIPNHAYLLPSAFKHVAMFLIVAAFIVMGAAQYPSRIKRIVRHPQLTGVMTWAVAHLLLNGDSRSILLFSWLGAWALLEIILINRREGVWVKPASPTWGREFRGLAISVIVIVVVVFIHPYIAGVPVR
ncbi:MAG: NnrU family protein [Arenicellales bacterium]